MTLEELYGKEKAGKFYVLVPVLALYSKSITRIAYLLVFYIYFINVVRHLKDIVIIVTVCLICRNIRHFEGDCKILLQNRS